MTIRAGSGQGFICACTKSLSRAQRSWLQVLHGESITYQASPRTPNANTTHVPTHTWLQV